MGKLEEALKDYSKAIEIYPKFSDAYTNRGRKYFNCLLGFALN